MVKTLQLDDDLVAAVQEALSRSGRSFEEVAQLLRRALSTDPAVRQPRPYRLEPASLGGPRAGIDLDMALRLADVPNDEARHL